MLATSIMAFSVAVIFFVAFRVGIASSLMLLALHSAIGFVFRYALLISYPQPPFAFWSVLTSRYDPKMDIIAIEISIGLIIVLLGYLAFRTQAVAPLAVSFVSSFLPKHPNRTTRAAIFVFLFSWAFFLLALVQYYGSISTAMLQLQRRAITFTSLVIIARSFLTVGFAAIAYQVFIWANKKYNGIAKPDITTPTLVVFHLLGTFLTGGRGAMLTQLFTIFLIYKFSVRREHIAAQAKTVIASIFGVVFIVLTVITGFTMRVSAQRGMSFSEAWNSVAPNFLSILSGTFPLTDLYTASRIFFYSEGGTFGQNYLNIVTRFIPRSIWVDKPPIMGLELRQFFYGDQLSGVPPTVFGEMHLAFGFVGVLILGFCFGGLLKFVDSLRIPMKAKPMISVFYFYAIFQLSFGIVKSGFENSLLHMIYFTFGLMMVKVLSRMRLTSRGVK